MKYTRCREVGFVLGSRTCEGGWTGEAMYLGLKPLGVGKVCLKGNRKEHIRDEGVFSVQDRGI